MLERRCWWRLLLFKFVGIFPWLWLHFFFYRCLLGFLTSCLWCCCSFCQFCLSMGEQALVSILAVAFLTPVLTHLIFQPSHNRWRRRLLTLCSFSSCCQRFFGLIRCRWRCCNSKAWFCEWLSMFLLWLSFLLDLVSLLDSDWFPLWACLVVHLVLRCFIFGIKEVLVGVFAVVLFCLPAIVLSVILSLMICLEWLFLQTSSALLAVVGRCSVFSL